MLPPVPPDPLPPVAVPPAPPDCDPPPLPPLALAPAPELPPLTAEVPEDPPCGAGPDPPEPIRGGSSDTGEDAGKHPAARATAIEKNAAVRMPVSGHAPPERVMAIAFRDAPARRAHLTPPVAGVDAVVTPPSATPAIDASHLKSLMKFSRQVRSAALSAICGAIGILPNPPLPLGHLGISWIFDQSMPLV